MINKYGNITMQIDKLLDECKEKLALMVNLALTDTSSIGINYIIEEEYTNVSHQNFPYQMKNILPFPICS